MVVSLGVKIGGHKGPQTGRTKSGWCSTIKKLKLILATISPRNELKVQIYHFMLEIQCCISAPVQGSMKNTWKEQLDANIESNKDEV